VANHKKVPEPHPHKVLKTVTGFIAEGRKLLRSIQKSDLTEPQKNHVIGMIWQTFKDAP